MGSDYATDPVSEKLRLCLCHSNEHPFSSAKHWSKTPLIKGVIDSYDNPSLAKSFYFWEAEEDAHIAFLWKHENNLICAIRIFKSFVGKICISENADKYKNIQNGFVSINVRNQEKRESTIKEELSRLAVNIDIPW